MLWNIQKLSKAIRQAERISKVGSARKNYSDSCFEKKAYKNAKTAKQSRAYKGYASAYNVDIYKKDLNS